MRRVPMGRQSGGLHSKGGAGGRPPRRELPSFPSGEMPRGRSQSEERRQRNLRKAEPAGWPCMRGWAQGRGAWPACQASLLSAPAFSDCVGRSLAGHEAQVCILTAPSGDSGP